MNRRRVLATLGGTLLGSGRLAAAPRPRLAPFTYEEARIYVPVAAHGRPLGDFILDTGSSQVVVDATRRQAARIEVAGETLARGVGQGALAVGHGGPARLEVGGVPLPLATTEVAAIDRTLTPYTGHPIGGIVGGPFFAQHRVTLDFQRSRLVLDEPFEGDRAATGAALPFDLVNGVPVVPGSITLPDGEILRLRLLVDTGAKANLLVAQPFVDANGLAERLGRTVVRPLGAGFGGETRYAFARLPQLTVGASTAARDLIVGLSVDGVVRGGFYDALLGAAFLRRFRTTFDYGRRELILAPRRREAPDEPFDRSGLFLIAEPGRRDGFTIDAVVPGSAAAAAGLRAGDTVVGVDGRAGPSLTLAAARARLAGSAPVVLDVARAGTRFRAKLALRPLL